MAVSKRFLLLAVFFLVLSCGTMFGKANADACVKAIKVTNVCAHSRCSRLCTGMFGTGTGSATGTNGRCFSPQKCCCT
ncbi:hypothetical protein Pint_36596 [Pistacia integerrima]|uniref:Uncharacterized protein n=1 Tax=Pistacia integerrima TaxID=434235 RepID=A0ACC0Y456_9ROSI|nr:hypothetical protein Pint_36596 [Pistacia integerrima]